jgi:hypothetical protein
MDSTAKLEPATSKQPAPAAADLADKRPVLTCECAWWGKPCPLFFWDDEPTDELAEANLTTSR